MADKKSSIRRCLLCFWQTLKFEKLFFLQKARKQIPEITMKWMLFWQKALTLSWRKRQLRSRATSKGVKWAGVCSNASRRPSSKLFYATIVLLCGKTSTTTQTLQKNSSRHPSSNLIRLGFWCSLWTQRCLKALKRRCSETWNSIKASDCKKNRVAI